MVNPEDLRAFSAGNVKFWLEKAQKEKAEEKDEKSTFTWIDDLFQGYPDWDDAKEAPHLHVIYHTVRTLIGGRAHLEFAMMKLTFQGRLGPERVDFLFSHMQDLTTIEKCMDCIKYFSPHELYVVGI